MEKAPTKSKKITQASTEEDDEYDYDDDEDMLDQIQTYSTSRSQQYTSLESNTKEKPQEKSAYGWFDMFLLFCLLLGIAIIFYQNLWSGRFCRKKFAKKLKHMKDEEDPDQEDNPIIKEELDMINESVELPRIRKKHDD